MAGTKSVRVCHEEIKRRNGATIHEAMKRLILAAALLSLLLASRSARAQCTVSNTVCITPGPDTTAFLSAAGVTIDQVLSQIDGLFQATNVNSFLHDFQNAQSFSS